MSHSPAPWKFGVYKYDDDGNSILSEMPYDYSSGKFCDNPFIYDANGEVVAGCDEYYAFSTPENVRLLVHAKELLGALKAEESHQQALRSFQSISDPLDDRLLGMKNEVDRTRSIANMLRREAIAKAEGK